MTTTNSIDEEPKPNPTLRELKPIMNLIFQKYSERKQNRTLIVLEPEPNTKTQNLGSFPSLFASSHWTKVC